MRVIVPPRKDAVVSRQVCTAPTQRDQHVLTIETADNDSWSVQLKLVGFDDPGGSVWNSFISGSDTFEQWAWDTLVTNLYDGPIA